MQHTSLCSLSSTPDLYMKKKAFFLIKNFAAAHGLLHDCCFSEIYQILWERLALINT